MHTTCGIINSNLVLELKWGVIVRAPGWIYIMMTMQFYILQTEPPIALVL